jgi:uncharacterized protein with HEPN domain
MSASKNPLVRLGHVRDEISNVTKALDGVTYEDFATNYVLLRTAQHALLIISEAVKALSPSFTDHDPGVDWRAVRDIGNVLRHDYFSIDPQVLGRVVLHRWPELRVVIDRMIEDHAPPRPLTDSPPA